jgi:protein gp37
VSDNSKIEWTEATWNPVTGCTKVSPGCDNCYAERITERFHGKGSFDVVRRSEEKLYLPLRWRKPRRVFVNSMSDLFHEDVPDSFIGRVFSVMAQTPQHSYQILTKRHGRMRSLLSRPSAQWAPTLTGPWPLPNCWLGVSVEDQHWADIRIPALLDTPAAVRWLSCEPLLGHVKLPFITEVDGCTCYGGTTVYGHEPRCGIEPGPAWGNLHWVVVGGESGSGARPMHPDWARSLRDQCTAVGVPFFFKQWGEWCHSDQMPDDTWSWLDSAINLGQQPHSEPHRVGKKRAGRELDGRTWDEYPAVTS